MQIVERTTSAAAADLWRYLGDLDRWADLLPTIDAIDRIDGAGPLGVGSRFRVAQPGLPVAEYTVTEWGPDSSFTWQARSAGITTTAVHEIEQAGARTLLRVGIGWAGPLAWLVRLLYRSKTDRYLTQEAETFVRLADREEKS